MSLKELIRDDIFISFLMEEMPWEAMYDHLQEIGFPAGILPKPGLIIDNAQRVKVGTFKREGEFKCELVVDRIKYRSFHKEGIYESLHIHRIHFIPLEALKDSMCALWEYGPSETQKAHAYDLNRWFKQ